jgi:hypothetical protein
MSDRPIRIQLSRAKGWRKPANTIHVARPNRDSNPYLIIHEGKRWAVWRNGRTDIHQARDQAHAHDIAVSLFDQEMRAACEADPQAAELMFARLRGRNLACWCAPHFRCHADVLLELANAPLRCEPA